ncbi:unnamed protein product, partial [Scytosiphon promiscuus]
MTMSLIEKCSGGPRNMTGRADERASDLLRRKVLRLDWQGIESISNLDIFTHLRELYLQHNRIQVIEELETLVNLEFLALGSNSIRRLENLRHLRKLQVLDLSNNMIGDIDTQELPPALVIMNLADNPCCGDPDFRRRITSSLLGLVTLDGVAVERWSHPAGVGEYKGSTEEHQLALGGKTDDDYGGSVVLHVSVLSGSECSIVPFRFSAAGNVEELASRFCTENSLHGDIARISLVDRMMRAIAGDEPRETPAKRHEDPIYEPGSDEEADESDPNDTDRRLHTILRLQRTRARMMQESTALFEQHKNQLMDTTRKLVKRKMDAAHDRSGALEADIKEIVRDARAKLELRRDRISTENRQFAADMRDKVDQVLAGRRRETESAMGGK